MSVSVDSTAGHESEAPGPGAEEERVEASPSLLERFLAVSLFWKITAANATVAAVIYILGFYVGVRVAPHVGTASLVGIAGGSLLLAAGGAVLLNALLVHLALSPIRELERVARRVEAGELDVRVGRSPLADHDLATLMDRFDQMLDALDRARDRQRRMASRILDSEERTRERIARELYDDIGQRIASILIRVPAAWRADDGKTRDAVLEGVRQELAETLERIRASARRLHPPELDDLGLAAAIRAEVRTVDEGGEVPVTLDAPPELEGPSRNAGLTLFRILQEALAVAEHGGGLDPIQVALDAEDGHLHGEVCQRGSRFADALNDPGPGLADLDELRERAEYVEGSATVRTAGERSILTVEIPGGGAAPDQGVDDDTGARETAAHRTA